VSTTAPLNDLDAMLKRLHLPTVRRLYPDLVLRAEAEGMSYRDFLEILVSEEIAHRAQTRITRSVRKAKFPFLRTIEEFDFTFQSSVRLQMLGTLLGPELVSEGQVRDSLRPARKRENASRGRHRLSCHPERLRGPLHHGRRADR
jgi:hypothetical protein